MFHVREKEENEANNQRSDFSMVPFCGVHIHAVIKR